MTSLSVVLLFSLLFLGLTSNNLAANQLSHDEKQDMITQAYTALKGVIDTLLQVHGVAQEGAARTDGDIEELEDSASRSEYQVNVMESEHQQMLAEMAKRTNIPAEEVDDATERGKAIRDAQRNITDFRTTITETADAQRALNQDMAAATLSPEHLENLQNKANAQLEDEDEHIEMPKTSEIKSQVTEELARMQTVIDSVDPAANERGEAQRLKDQISAKFDTLLTVPGPAIPQLIVTAKEIDTLLLMFRNLNICGAAARMEL